MLEYISVNLNAKPEVINAFYKTIPVYSSSTRI